MESYLELDKSQAQTLYDELMLTYENYQNQNLSLDMSRGKPAKVQLDASNEMLHSLNKSEDCICETGFDCRSYGLLDGIPEAKKMFAPIIGVDYEHIIIGGNSSLTMMYDVISKGMTHGLKNSPKPWALVPDRKFLCPAPGYDRHFGITQSFGFELITIPMLDDGPDMDMVEDLVSKDPSIKGIWCVPKYSNPEGKTYSDKVVRRFAALKPAAPDFCIMWDNAYVIHDIYDDGDHLLNIYDECKLRKTTDMVYIFASTSKVTFPGSGISFLGSSRSNIEYMKKLLFYQTISPDKLNQMRHVKYFKTTQGVVDHMKLHAKLLRPKFELVLDKLDKELTDTGCGNWIKPRGGYFISFNAYHGCAKRIVELAKEAGIKMTSAGATYPYGVDPNDSNIRIAPSFPPLEELSQAMDIFCLCAKIATLEKVLNK